MHNRFSAVLRLAVFSTFVFLLIGQSLRAQGSGAATFSETYTVPPSASTTYLAIPNNNQVGHSVNVTFSRLLHSGCAVYLDTSSDNATWYSIGSSGNIFNTRFDTGTFFANGAAVYYRLKILPCAGVTIGIVYMGYGAFLPNVPDSATFSANPYAWTELPADSNIYPVTPNILEGFQCSSPDTGNAISASTLDSGGGGYANNDTGTIDGGTILATYKILAVVAFAVTGVDQTGGAGVNYFTVTGNQTAHFVAGHTFKVAGSTGNNGTYTVTSSAFGGGSTNIVTVQVIPNATVDGSITADDAAVLTYSLTSGGDGYTTGIGITTSTGGAQPGVGKGFTIDISAVSSGVEWLQLYFSNLNYTSPVCNSPGVWNFEAAIPAGGTFTYGGPPINLSSWPGPIVAYRTCARVVTAQGGNIPVAAAKAPSCNFQFNYSGPYYPYNPLSP